VTDRLDENKLNAIAFYELMFNESRPREAIDRYAVLQVVPARSVNDNTMF